jgi:hypothetical protein
MYQFFMSMTVAFLGLAISTTPVSAKGDHRGKSGGHQSGTGFRTPSPGAKGGHASGQGGKYKFDKGNKSGKYKRGKGNQGGKYKRGKGTKGGKYKLGKGNKRGKLSATAKARVRRAYKKATNPTVRQALRQLSKGGRLTRAQIRWLKRFLNDPDCGLTEVVRVTVLEAVETCSGEDDGDDEDDGGSGDEDDDEAP